MAAVTLTTMSPVEVAARTALALAFIVFAGKEVDKAYDDVKESIAELKEVAQENIDRSMVMKDLWLQHQHPQKLKALCTALELEIPVMGKATAWDRFLGFTDIVTNQAKAAKQRLFKQYGVCQDVSCDRTLDVAGMNAYTNAGYALYRAQQRRTERRRDTKIRLLQSSHAASFTDPGPINRLAQTATDIAGNNLTSAYSVLNGATSLVGTGLGLLNFGTGTSSSASTGVT